MKLITEINESIEYIIEEKNGKKSMHINGVFMMGETKNRNGRVYPHDILMNEVKLVFKDKRLTNIDKKVKFIVVLVMFVIFVSFSKALIINL